MINFNIAQAVEQEPISHAEFSKAVDAIGLVVIDEDGLNKFLKDLNGLIQKGEASALTQDEVDAIEKGKKDYSKLVKKTITAKSGVKKTVYVKAGDNKPAEKKSGKEETGGKTSGKNEGKDSKGTHQTAIAHAKESFTSKLQEYVKNGTDPDLVKIAKKELEDRGEHSGEATDDDRKAGFPEDSELKRLRAARNHTDTKQDKKDELTKQINKRVEELNKEYDSKKGKADPADGMAKNAAKKHAGTKGKLGEAAKEAKKEPVKHDHSALIHTDSERIAKEAGVSHGEFKKMHPKTKMELSANHPPESGGSEDPKVKLEQARIKQVPKLSDDDLSDWYGSSMPTGGRKRTELFSALHKELLKREKDKNSKFYLGDVTEKAYSPDLLKAFESFNIKP